MAEALLRTSLAHRDIIVVGASAGGLAALVDLITPLPSDLRAAIFVVVHTPPEGSGLLPQILQRATAWQVAYATDGEAITSGRIYVAPPDRHLLVKRERIRVTSGPRENRFRPAVDPLFRTAARAFGARVVGIVLSGGLDDGTHGLELIKRHGGVAIAQDPEDALMPSMPLSAIQNVEVDHILKPPAIGLQLRSIVVEGVEDDAHLIDEETDVSEGLQDNLQTGHVPGPPSPFICPDCGGALWEMEDGKLLRFRCHVGHSFTADALMTTQDESLETTLWGALRTLEEHAALRRRMAIHAEHLQRGAVARALQQQARDAEVRAAGMRRLLLQEARSR